MNEYCLGPIDEILPLCDLPNTGHIEDQKIKILKNGYIHVKNGKIESFKKKSIPTIPPPKKCVALPAFIDAHTHICYAGSRARDFADRLNRIEYQEILARGGGIHDTVAHTQLASQDELTKNILKHCKALLSWGVLTCEVKSGYGLSVEHELKMLRSIKEANHQTPVELIPTCLAAHVPPKNTLPEVYLKDIIKDLFPLLIKEKLSQRIDIFIEENAFPVELARTYLKKAKEIGFILTIHADQFSRGGVALACEVGAISAEHLEASNDKDLIKMKKSNVTPVVLPGASIGLGMPYAPAGKILDHNLPLVLASDWNPGSAPMGDLLTQTSLIAASEKLSTAEAFTAITSRPAKLLNLNKGILKPGYDADFLLFPCNDYREILYSQGRLKPIAVYSKGSLVYEK